MHFEKNNAFNHRSFLKSLHLCIKSVYHLFPVYHHWSKYGTVFCNISNPVIGAVVSCENNSNMTLIAQNYILMSDDINSIGGRLT